MYKLIFLRVIAVIPILIGVSVISFSLMQLIPGDITLTLLGPFATDSSRKILMEFYGLDQPIYIQYYKWLGNFIQGDFGRSIAYKMPISEIIFIRVFNTAILTLVSATIAIFVGFLFGILSGIKRFSFFDRICTLMALIAASAPTFWISIMLLYVFSLKLRWFPATGMYSIGKDGDIINLLWHLPLPALSASFVSLAVIFRLSRSNLLDILNQDYIRAAKARGIPRVHILGSYAIKILLPGIVNISGLQIGFIFGASLFVEVIFQWPGVGLLMYNATLSRDVPMIQAVLLILAIVFVIVNLISDIVTSIMNPQLRNKSTDKS